jgi:hypothetical protein
VKLVWQVPTETKEINVPVRVQRRAVTRVTDDDADPRRVTRRAQSKTPDGDCNVTRPALLFPHIREFCCLSRPRAWCPPGLVSVVIVHAGSVVRARPAVFRAVVLHTRCCVIHHRRRGAAERSDSRCIVSPHRRGGG